MNTDAYAFNYDTHVEIRFADDMGSHFTDGIKKSSLDS